MPSPATRIKKSTKPKAADEPSRKPQKDGEQVFVENYNGIPIYQRYNGHYIGEKWFAGLQQAKRHIDDLAASEK